MRPGVTLPPLDEFTGSLPEGWVYQVKLDDERAMLSPTGELFNRHGNLYSHRKAKVYEAAKAR